MVKRRCEDDWLGGERDERRKKTKFYSLVETRAKADIMLQWAPVLLYSNSFNLIFILLISMKLHECDGIDMNGNDQLGEILQFWNGRANGIESIG